LVYSEFTTLSPRFSYVKVLTEDAIFSGDADDRHPTSRAHNNHDREQKLE
jgi:hypothetical protein